MARELRRWFHSRENFDLTHDPEADRVQPSFEERSPMTDSVFDLGSELLILTPDVVMLLVGALCGALLTAFFNWL